MKFTIEQQTAQDVIDYLVQQPFKDVASLIDKLSRLEPVQETNHSEDTVVMPRSKSAS